MQLEQIVVDLAGNKIVKQVQQELTSIAATLQIHINYDQGSKMIADTLRLIILRANKAFTDQEALMEASGYLSFARHRRHHQTLLSIIDIMIKESLPQVSQEHIAAPYMLIGSSEPQVVI